LTVLDRWTSAAAVVAAGASAVDLLYLADTVLDGLVHLLLFLVVARLCTLRGPADARVVAFLSFFMLVAASSASFGVSFLFVFLAYLLLTTWMLLLQHVLAESEPAPGRSVVGAALDLRSGRGLLALALAASATTLAISAVFFFVIPRVGLAALPFRGRTGPLVTGFSDRVELGAYGQIETDSSIAMRVHVPAGASAPDQIPDLRWRGIVFDEFDGQAWTVGRPERAVLRRSGSGPGDFRLAPPRGRGRSIFYEVYLEPIGTDVIFAAPRVLRVTLRSDSLTVDDMESLSVASATARLHYVVESELAEGPLTYPALGRMRSVDAGDPAFARYLQLPRLPSRIGVLAREVTAGSRDAYQAAVILSEHLARQYRYTLALDRLTSLSPVDEFLFVRRSGNCEYFAAALAVMLRTLGIPARVVGGFQRGEWNPYGRYFTVRMRDAHSWVEAYIAGAGWVTLDPSPRADAETASAQTMWSLYLDSLRMRWYRYVVNWSLRDQVETAVAIRRQASTFTFSSTSLPTLRDLPPAAPVGVAVVLLAGGVLLWRRDRRRPAVLARARPPRFYERALRQLSRRGLRPAHGETAREFCARVVEAAPAAAAPFSALTATYERVRFGATALAPADAAAAEGDLAELNAGLHSTRASRTPSSSSARS
ncbi:MAG TPA: transglutaminaseTgpA domain-containing protein, partial [Candidatus Limnocylindrales bacterium]|nr:transglutaminaseTgpA domain-containing protein [Candidatus Limnocylindrales bacterium]